MIRQMNMSKVGEGDEKSRGKVETAGERKDEGKEQGGVVLRAEQTETKIVSRLKRIQTRDQAKTLHIKEKTQQDDMYLFQIHFFHYLSATALYPFSKGPFNKAPQGFARYIWTICLKRNVAGESFLKLHIGKFSLK